MLSAADPGRTGTDRPLILLAEDDTLTRVLLTRALRGAGFAVAPVARADELLHLAFGLEPLLGVVVLDLLLGGYDSSHLLPLLRTVAAARSPAATTEAPAASADLAPQGRTGGPHPALSVPAILISVHPELEHEAQRCGADAWLSKPVAPAALAATVRRLLARP